MASIASLTRFWGDMFFTDSEGSGLTLVFLHGTGCDSTDWEHVTERLPREKRFITLDFRGHGRSSIPIEPFSIGCLADDVINLIYATEIQELILVGHSLGGMVATEVARRDSRVTALVLLEGWTSLSTAKSAFNVGRFYGSLPPTKVKGIQHKASITRERFLPRVWDSFWTSVRDFNSYTFLENAEIPIYEVFGEMGRNESTEKMLCIPPNPKIRMNWVPNTGHYLLHECPNDVAAICNSCIDNIIRNG